MRLPSSLPATAAGPTFETASGTDRGPAAGHPMTVRQPITVLDPAPVLMPYMHS
jgi:hypothetical protein